MSTDEDYAEIRYADDTNTRKINSLKKQIEIFKNKQPTCDSKQEFMELNQMIEDLESEITATRAHQANIIKQARLARYEEIKAQMKSNE